jgi:hypothetical protein
MNEAPIDLEDESADADVRVKSYGASDDHLATTRLPSVAGGRPPLPPARVPSVPPSGLASAPQSSFSPASPPAAFASTGVLPPAASPAPSVELPRAAPAPQSGWWRALLASTRPPAGPSPAVAPLDDRTARERIAAASASLGLAIMLLALVVGLREAPGFLLATPAVAASVVLARAAVSIAMFFVGFSCLRAAERMYFR